MTLPPIKSAPGVTVIPFGYNAMLRKVKQLADLEDEERRTGLSITLRVVLGGNCNIEFLEPGLILGLAAEGIDVKIRKAGFDAWAVDALDAQTPCDIRVVWLSSMGLTRGGSVRPEPAVETLQAVAEAVRTRGERLVVILPDALEFEQAGFSLFATWRNRWHAAILRALNPSAVCLDPEPLQRELSASRWHAGRYWAAARAACHPDAAARLGFETARIIARLLRPRVRAILVDLDNTLWGGVVGDDGVSGLELDPFGSGAPFLRLQRFLKDLSAGGIPLCAVSKNDSIMAERPFRERPEMVLRREDLLFFEVSWEPKPIAIRRIIKALNLGADQVCFLDDSRHERAQARLEISDLLVPELPEDPEGRVPYLINLGWFIQPALTDDDRIRVDSYRSELDRKAERDRIGDPTAYLRSLEMVVTAHRIGQDNLPRVTSLVHKTNQFNLTGRRRSEADISAFAHVPSNYAYAFSVHDRFGDSGIISVILGERTGSDLRIDTWVMSCRVFGRGIEYAVFEHLIHWCRASDVVRLRGEYRPTERNQLVSDLFDQLGFQLQDSATTGSRRYVTSDPRVPEHFARIETS